MSKTACAVVALLSLVSVDAAAETQVTTTRSTPIATSTANNGARDDVRVTSAGTLQTSGAGAAATLDSNNQIVNEGTIKILDANDAVGIAVRGGNTGTVTNNGSITISDTTPATTIPLTNGERRFGIQVTGPNPFFGSITQGTGNITVIGNNSAGISLETRLEGFIALGGSTQITGNNSVGLRTRGVVVGDVTVSGTIIAKGQNASAASFEQSILGRLTLQNSMTATGYLNTVRPTDAAALAALGPNDLLQGGPVVRVAGDVGNGIIVDTSGALTSSGSAPALLIGGSANSRLGIAGADTDNAALLVRGALASDGIYNNITATALQIGGQGGTVTLDGGIRNTGQINANAYAANSTALRAAAGAIVPALRNEGSIQANGIAESAITVSAVRIEQGATLNSIANSGTISASVNGTSGTHTPVAGAAVAIQDLSGTLTAIGNQGRIVTAVNPGTAGEATVGSRTAIDVRANTSGVTFNQTQIAGSTTAPSVIGDVLFGSGNDTLNLNAGTLKGGVAFGNGADTLNINNGAVLTGSVTDTDGRVVVGVANGKLVQTGFGQLNVSSLNVGAQGQVVLAVDPATGRFGSIASSGGVNLVQGSRLGLDIQSKLTAPLALTLITAPSAQLQSQVTLGDVPYFYNATLVQSAAAGTIGVQVRRRTAAEAGITVGAQAYDAIFQQHDKDVQLGQAFSRAVNQASFKTLYERMLPAFAGGQFYTLSQGVDALVRAQGEDALNLRPARDGFWVQPFGFGATRERDQAPAFRGGGYGLAIGWEKPNTSIGTYGFSLSSLRSWVDDKDSDPDNRTVSNSYLLGAYWQESGNGINVSASVNGGYVNSGSTRKLTSTDANDASFTRNAEARWGGLLGSVRAALSYKADLWGSFYARPKVAASYLILQENEHAERGTSDGFNLQVGSRNSTQGAIEGTVAFGAALGSGAFKWRPEVEVGYRQLFGDGAASTTAQFLSGGPSFTLDPQKLQGGAPLARIALRGGDRIADIGLELGGEDRSGYRAYDGRFVARMRF
ncbi:autotransporter domain-containing protein [Roseiterribacter gracilis]|uniref:Autotransporter n=1 Tax=Roseiterribacter gracilis TaxID=2812848 RepID=A0A8S8X8U1_9PROT|nr:autotransporter [Rhodospirillales bacterium TMPK1]